jgi:Flp pilus assembly protein TadD
MEKGEMEEAVKSFERAKQLDPKNAEAPYYLGIAFERFVQRERALVEYKLAADLDTAHPQYVIAAAEMYIDLGRLDEAESFLAARGTTFEHNAGVKQTLGHIAMIRGDTAKGVALFGEARLLAPDDQAITEDLIHAQVGTGAFADAEYNIQKLLQAPDNTERRDLRMLRAKCLVHVNRLLDAREVLIKLTEGDAGQADAQAWIDLASVSYMLKDHTRTRQASSRAIALAPDRSDGYVLRGLQMRRDGDLNNARVALEKAASIKPEPGPVMVLGMVLQELGDFEGARRNFEIAQRLAPQDQAATGLMTAVPVN